MASLAKTAVQATTASLRNVASHAQHNGTLVFGLPNFRPCAVRKGSTNWWPKTLGNLHKLEPQDLRVLRLTCLYPPQLCSAHLRRSKASIVARRVRRFSGRANALKSLHCFMAQSWAVCVLPEQCPFRLFTLFRDSAEGKN